MLGPAAIVDQQMTVLSLAPVQETGKVEVFANLTKSQKMNRRRKLSIKRKKIESLEKREGTENPGSVGAIDQIASGDILSTKVHEAVSGETDKDEVSVKLTKSQKINRRRKLKIKLKKNLESLENREGTENPESLGAIASADPKMMVLSPAATAEGKSSFPCTNATGQIGTKVHEAVSGETGSGKIVTDSTSSKKRKRNQRAKKTVVGDELDAKVGEVVTGETVPGKTVADNTTTKKKKRKLKKVTGDILSTCENIQGKVDAIEGSNATEVTEAISGEMILGKTALPDVKMVSKEEEHTEAVSGKMESSATANLNVKGAVNSSLTIGEILTPQNLQNLKADNGETGPGSTAADTTESKKRKRRKKMKKSPLLGDILSTCENIQDKENAVDGLSTTKVLDTKVTNKMELSDITNHNVDGKKGPEVVTSEIGASNRTSKQKTKKQKVVVNPRYYKKITKLTVGKKLVIFDVNGMLADIVYPFPTDVEADKYYRDKAVFKRPYLDDFLSFCFEKFNVGIWSSKMKRNLHPVVNCLFGDLQKKLLFTWDALHCTNSQMRTLENRYKFIVFKELRKIWEKNGRLWLKGTFNESNTLLLDDSPYKALLNPKHTGIFPTSYKYTDTNDDFLGPTGALRAYLEGFAAADDGRTYVEQNPFGQGPIDETNRDWNYYSHVLKNQKQCCNVAEVQNEENLNEKESDKQKVNEKEVNEKERNDNLNKNQVNDDATQKEKEVKRVKKPLRFLVSRYMNNKTAIKTQGEEMLTDYLFSMQGDPCNFVFETKEGTVSLRDNMQTLAPQLKVDANVIDSFSVVLNHEEKINPKDTKKKHFFHTGMITKNMFEWKKEDGKYDEEKQYAAFSESIKSVFKHDADLIKMENIEMAFFPIIAHRHFYLVVFNLLKGTSVIIDNSKLQQTYDTKYKTVCDLLRIMFSKHLKGQYHPRAKDVLTKEPTILIPKWGTKYNDTDCGVFVMMHMENYNGETAENWNLEFPTEGEEQNVELKKMRIKIATKMLTHEINKYRDKMSEEAHEFAKHHTDKQLRQNLIRDAIKKKKREQDSERVQSAI